MKRKTTPGDQIIKCKITAREAGYLEWCNYHTEDASCALGNILRTRAFPKGLRNRKAFMEAYLRKSCGDCDWFNRRDSDTSTGDDTHAVQD